MNPDQLGGDSHYQLPSGEENLVGSDEHASNLEWGQFSDVCDQNRLSESDTHSYKDRRSEPVLPFLGGDFGHRPGQQDTKGDDHPTSKQQSQSPFKSRDSYSLPANLVHEGSSEEHACGFRHFGESLEEGDGFGTNRWFSIDSRIGHLSNERWEGDDVTGNLLLELVFGQRGSSPDTEFTHPIV